MGRPLKISALLPKKRTGYVQKWVGRMIVFQGGKLRRSTRLLTELSEILMTKATMYLQSMHVVSWKEGRLLKSKKDEAHNPL